MPVARPTIFASAIGELNTRSEPNSHLQARGQFEDSAFALYQLVLEVFFAAAVRHIFAEDDDAFIAAHFIAQRGIDQIGHRLIGAAGCLPSAAVSGAETTAAVSKAAEVGSRSGEYTKL